MHKIYERMTGAGNRRRAARQTALHLLPNNAWGLEAIMHKFLPCVVSVTPFGSGAYHTWMLKAYVRCPLIDTILQALPLMHKF